VNIDPDDGLLNDYLDERLDSTARAAFEARIARDPALARRVELGREIRRALRADGEEPSPAFYARARERFEAGTRRAWFRPLSWEVLGVAVAAMLAVVVFLPGLLRHEDLLPPAPERRAIPELAEPQRAPQASDDLGAAAPPASRAKDRGPAGPAARADTETENKAIAPPVNEGASRQLEDEFAPAPEPAPKPASESAGARVAPEERQERYSVLGKSSAAQAPAVAGVETQTLETDAAKSSATQAFAVPLHAGTVGHGEVRTIDSREAWLDLLERMPEGDLPPPSDDHVLVLIGPREAPFACAPIAVVPRDGARVIELPAPAAGEPGSAGGCAVVLPRTGGRVLVVGPGEGP